MRLTQPMGPWEEAFLIVAATVQAVVLFWWAFSVLRRKRIRVVRERRGLCPACGYDVRGIRHRCPECAERLYR